MLITIRHGETDYNINNIYSGQTDAPRLTKKAHIDAFNIGKKLLSYNSDIAIVSSLTRAKETFEEINKSLNIPFIVNSNLIERDFKEFDCTPGSTLNPKIYWDVELDGSVNIETIKDLVIRVEKELDKLKRKYKDKNVLIVAHSGVCRVVKYILEGKKEKNLYNYQMENLHMEIYKEW